MRKKVPEVIEEKKETNNEKDNYRSLILPTITIIFIITIMLGGMFYCISKMPQPKDYFIKYEDATMLVEIQHGEYSKLFGYKKIGGFINKDVYEKYKNNEYNEMSITVHHPYLQGSTTMIITDSIVTITPKSYETFYETYSLKDIIKQSND